LGATGEKMADHNTAFGGGELAAQEPLQQGRIRVGVRVVPRELSGMPFGMLELWRGTQREILLHGYLSSRTRQSGWIGPKVGIEQRRRVRISTHFEDPAN
jgi:hypothetical protein